MVCLTIILVELGTKDQGNRFLQGPNNYSS